MKKFFAILILLFSVISVFANDNDFFNALQNCSSYSNNGETKTDGILAKFQSQISGWDNNKCIYKEHVNYSGIDAITTCKFSQRQLDELVDVMRAYSKVQSYSTDKLDTSSLDNIKGNPVVNVWNKYLMDSSVCNIELSQ